MSDLDQEYISKCFYIHASLLGVSVCVVRTPRQPLSEYEQHRAEVLALENKADVCLRRCASESGNA